jgi:hypothetical protein
MREVGIFGRIVRAEGAVEVQATRPEEFLPSLEGIRGGGRLEFGSAVVNRGELFASVVDDVAHRAEAALSAGVGGFGRLGVGALGRRDFGGGGRRAVSRVVVGREGVNRNGTRVVV